MRASIALLLLLRVLPSIGEAVAPVVPVCQSKSLRSECNGIEGTGKNADICCASDCECSCGGDDVPENKNKDCFLTEIRTEPPGKCNNETAPGSACVLDSPGPVAGVPCGTIDGVVVEGIVDEDGMLCCPEGCGTCGGTTCSTMPMSWVKPHPNGEPLAVDPSVPEDATSGDFCCMRIMETLEAVCGVDGVKAPCRMPQIIPPKEDTCGVDGIEGTAHLGGGLCCPLGCDICGSTGCGDQHISEVLPGDLPWSTSAPPNATTTEYCCTDAFKEDNANQDRFCGDVGVEPPCLIPKATLPPRDPILDSCFVEGIEGVANGNKCCPLGCGQCGGPGCGSIDMGYVIPTLEGQTLGLDPKASQFCCSGATTFTAETPTCGGGNFPPCIIAASDPPAQGAPPAPGAPAAAPTPADGPMGEIPGAPAVDLPDTCNLPGMPGILDKTGSRCCPQGCGMCGGPGCGSIDMTLVTPTVSGGLFEGKTKSGAYCCFSGVDERAATCGTGDPVAHPPCLIPAEPNTDSCNVEGVQGIASTSRKECCPLGCGQCGGDGCGSIPETQIFSDGRALPPDATASSYCCVGGGGFTNSTMMCDEPGAEPPCFIPAGTPTPPPVVTPAPVETTNGDGGDADPTPPSPATATTPAPTGAPTEMMSCENVSVMIEDAEEFDGSYVMDTEDELLFVKNDTTAVMEYVPHDEVDMDMIMDMGMDDTNTTSTTNSSMNSTMDSSANATECGYWMLSLLMDDNVTKAAYPMVVVQDCATNPEFIEPAAVWVVKRQANETAVSGGGAVECSDVLATPSPATPSPVTPPPSDSSGGTPAPPSGNTAPVAAPVAAPATTPAPLDDDPKPASPPASSRAAPTADTSSGDDGSRLSTGEAVGVGVGVSVVAIVGGVALTRWAKSR